MELWTVSAGLFGVLAGWGWSRLGAGATHPDLDKALHELARLAGRLSATEAARSATLTQLARAETEAASLRAAIDEFETRLARERGLRFELARDQRDELNALREARERAQSESRRKDAAIKAALADMHQTLERAAAASACAKATLQATRAKTPLSGTTVRRADRLSA